jgi:hypothetical protein
MSPTKGLHRLGRVGASAVLVILVLLLLAGSAQARDLRASVKGLVLDAVTKKGVPNVRVYVMEKIYPWGPTNPGYDHDWDPLASGVTGKSGAYTVKLPRAGTFRVFFVPADRVKWAMEAYPDAAVPELGDDVVVKYGPATSGISVKLDPSNRMEGHIYDARSRWDGEGNPLDPSQWTVLPGIEVFAAFQGLVRINGYIDFPEEPLGEAYTDANGFYSIPGFKPYPFFAWANFPWADQWDPQLVDLIIQDGTSEFPGQVKQLDGALQPVDFVNLKGRLVEEVDGALVPVANKTVNVYVSDYSPELERPFWDDPEHEVTTDEDGCFSCVNLPEPAALLEFRGDETFQNEFFDDCDYWGAPEIPVDWGRTEDIGDWIVSRWP